MFVELKAEIDRLRSQSGVMNEEQQSASLAEITALKEKLAVREKEMEEMTRYGVDVNSSYWFSWKLCYISKEYLKIFGP